MSGKSFTRRKFLQFGGGGSSIFFLLKYFRNFSEKVKISFQSSFLPISFKKTLPRKWTKQNINFGQLELEKNENKLSDSDFLLINDGWINSLNLNKFENIMNTSLLDKLNKRSINYLDFFDENIRKKLFPIGVIPYAIVIKDNKDLIYAANQSWDFLLSKKLTGKIILPKSPRIIMSIAKATEDINSLEKIKSQVMMYEDKNTLNWLSNSQACLAILPYTICYKYSKIDPRISLVFPSQGVPLMWNFILSKSKYNTEILFKWIDSLEKNRTIDKLSTQGWYLPFNNEYSQSKFNNSDKSKISSLGPSKECWQKSWSFEPLDSQRKKNYEKLWNQSLIP